MPRRIVSKCGRRNAGASLDPTDELCLSSGHAFGIHDWEEPLRDPAAFRRLWGQWGAEITSRWIEAFPGSRPIGVYLAGTIETPAWRHSLEALRRPIHFGGRIAIQDRGWHSGAAELEHLVALGVVDAGERARAIERLGQSTGRDHSRYSRLATD